MGTSMAIVRYKGATLCESRPVRAVALPDLAAPNFNLELLEARRLLSGGFGQQGWTHVDMPATAGGTGVPAAMASAPDGKIYIAGGTEGPGNYKALSVARFNADGTPDTSFGADGSATVSLPYGDLITADHILVQSDGKLVITAETPQGLAVVRLNSDGSVDNGFGGGLQVLDAFNGFSSTEIDFEDAAWLMPNGDVALMAMNGPDLVTVQLNSAGQPDSSFGSNGIVSTTIDPKGDEVGGDNLLAAEPLANGNILAYANIWSYATTADGTDDGPAQQELVQIQLDANSNVLSQQTVNLGLSLGNEWYGDYAMGPAVVLASDGSAYVSSIVDRSIEKLTLSGQGDSSFGVDGVASMPGKYIQVWAMTQDNHLLVQSGASNPLVWGEENGILRLNSDGSVDNSFNGGEPVGNGVYPALPLSDGSLLLGYWGYEDGNASFVIEKVNVDGSVDAGSNAPISDAAVLAVIARQNTSNSVNEANDAGLFWVPGSTVWDPNGDQSVLDGGGATT